MIETVDGISVKRIDGLITGWQYCCTDCETEFIAQKGQRECPECGSEEVKRPHEC